MKAVETFKYNNNTHQEIRFYCKWFSDKLKTVVSEHLNSLSGHSSIIGYYGPPSDETLNCFNPGKIVVLKQDILGHPNTCVVPDINSEEPSRLVMLGPKFYEDVARIVQPGSSSSSSWKCVPNVLMPGQIPFSFAEEFFDVDPIKINQKDIIDWMKSNPPRVVCSGITLNTTDLEQELKLPITLGAGIEFYALGHFHMELRDKDRSFTKIVYAEGKITLKAAMAYKKFRVLPQSNAENAYVGFILYIEDDNTVHLKSVECDLFDLSISGCMAGPVNDVVFKKGTSLNIANLHNIEKP